MIEEFGWNANRQAAYENSPLSFAGGDIGRVVRMERDHAVIATWPGTAAESGAANESDASTAPAAAPATTHISTVPTTGCVVGDWVVTDGATWAEPLERATLLSRQSSDRTSDEQALAANIDTVLVVEPMTSSFSARRIERMLTLAWASGAEPLVVLTKADIGDQSRVEEAHSSAGATPVIALSSATGKNLNLLRERLGFGRTFVMLGISGAGKSSLVNAIAGRELLETGEVRRDDKGRHTTTHRELVSLGEFGCLIDAPGIRGVGMVSDPTGLDQTFGDISALARECRFSDCSHETEPGCAVMDAVINGHLDPDRLASYQRLKREIAHQSSRKTSRDRTADKADTRGRQKAKRTAMRAKGR